MVGEIWDNQAAETLDMESWFRAGDIPLTRTWDPLIGDSLPDDWWDL